MLNFLPIKSIINAFCLVFLLFSGLKLSAQLRQIGLYEPNEVIIQFKASTAGQKPAALRQLQGANLLGSIPDLRVELWKLPASQTLNRQGKPMDLYEQIAEIEKAGGEDVLSVQPNYRYGVATTPPNDTHFDKQWALQNTGWNGCGNGNDIAALAAWEIRSQAKFTRMGVLDTGVDWKHPDLKANIWQNLAEDADGDSAVIVWNGSQWVLDPGDLNGIDNDGNGYVDDLIGWDFANNDNNPMDDNGHGTHVAGIIGAKSDNNLGVAGVAGAGIQMIPLKILDESGSGTSYTTLLALQYCVQKNVRITNNSYGGGAYDPILHEYITFNCKNAGMLFVAAAGNKAINNDLDPLYPASYEGDNIISVGAHNCNLIRAPFSNFGAQSVDIFAPGDAIYSTDLGGGYSFRSGTSMAAPFVAAAAALTMRQFPGISVSDLHSRIITTATPASNLADLCVSAGRLNLHKILSEPYQASQASISQQGGGWATYYSEMPAYDFAEQGEYIWMATPGGLLRQNKTTEENTIYNVGNSGIMSNHVNCVAVQPGTNYIWAGLAFGVSIFDGTNWDAFTGDDLPGSPIDITDIHFGPGNQIWVGTEDNGLYHWNGNIWNRYYLDNGGFNSNNVQSISQESSGRVWVATWGQGLFSYHNNVWTQDSPLGDNFLYTVYIDNLNQAWAGSTVGLYKKNGGLWTLYNTQNNIYLTNVYGITGDTQGNLWLRVNEGNVGMLRWQNQGSWFNYGIQSVAGFEASSIISFFADSQDRLWLSSDLSVKKQDANPLLFSRINTANSDLASNNISVSAIDKQGRKWFGFEEGNISVFDGINWTYVYHFTFAEKPIRAIGFDNDGQIFVGTDTGLSVFNGTTWAFYDHNNTPYYDINVIHNDQDGNTWIGTGHGLYIYGSGPPFINQFFVTSSTYINCITEAFGKVYVGTNTGVGIIQNLGGSSWTFADWQGQPHPIHSIAVATDSSVYILVTDGVFKSIGNNNIWSFFNNQGTPLPDAYVPKVVTDKLGNAWFVCGGASPSIISYDGIGSWETYDEYNSGIVLAPNNGGIIADLLIDDANNKWVSALGVSVLYDEPVSFGMLKQSVCLGESLTFFNGGQESGNYQWRVNGITVSTNYNYTHTFNQLGFTKIELVSQRGNTLKSFFRYIRVLNPLQVNLGQDTSLCANNFFLDANVNAAQYNWYGLGGTPLDTTSYYTVSGAGTHTVILEITDFCGSTSRDSVTVTLGGDCILPGDVNSDGRIDMEDFLTLIYLDGRTGPPRPNATSERTYQTGPDWATALIPNVNDKHGDCNGDGTIVVSNAANADNHVVVQNVTHALYRKKAIAASPYTLRMIKDNPQPFLNIDDTIKHEVKLEREGGLPVGSVAREVGFSLRYNMNFNENPFLNTDNSFLRGVTLNNTVIEAVLRLTGQRNADFGMMTAGSGGSGGTAGTVGSVPKNKDIDTTHSTKSVFLTMTTYNAIIADANGSDTLVQTATAHNTETIEIRLPWNWLDIRLFLQGAYDSTSGNMRTDLRTQNLLPAQHPYGADILPNREVELPNGVVDWVLLELRAANNPSPSGIISRQAVWLMSDGSLRDTRNGGGVYMMAKAGDYYLVVKHRNHLAVMSSTPLSLTGNDQIPVSYYFHTENEMAFGTNAQAYLGNNAYGLMAGDANADGELNYDGTDNDHQHLINLINDASDPTQTVSNGYCPEDTNLDGKVKISGAGNDRGFILQNIGGTSISGSIQSQVPQ